MIKHSKFYILFYLMLCITLSGYSETKTFSRYSRNNAIGLNPEIFAYIKREDNKAYLNVLKLSDATIRSAEVHTGSFAPVVIKEGILVLNPGGDFTLYNMDAAQIATWKMDLNETGVPWDIAYDVSFNMLLISCVKFTKGSRQYLLHNLVFDANKMTTALTGSQEIPFLGLPIVLKEGIYFVGKETGLFFMGRNGDKFSVESALK